MARAFAVRFRRGWSSSVAAAAAAAAEGLPFSSVPGSEPCVAAATEAKIKKAAGGGKPTIAERILAVVDKIHKRRLPPELRRGAANSATAADPTRVEAKIVNVAEQRILRSMMNGDFENLPGRGKPLRLEGNPHADPAEDMAYRILAKNGFAPEWVSLTRRFAS